MKKIFTLSLLFFLSAPAFCKEEISADMKEAVNLYFSFKQEEALNKFIEISKTNKERDAFLNAAYIALELGNSRLAVDTMATALQLFPEDTTVLEFAGEAYLSSGYYLNAENIFARLSEKNDKTEFYFINLARAQIGLNQLELAKLNLKQAAAGANHISLSNFLLGSVYEQQKRYEDAAHAYKKTVDYDSQFVEAKQKYANVLVKLKKYKEALKNYNAVATVESSLQETTQAIAKIDKKIRREDKISPVVTLGPKQHTHVKSPVSYEGKLPTIRVGISAKINGAPEGMKSLKFATAYKFKASDKNDKTLVNGKAKEFWTVEITNNVLYLKSPKGVRTKFDGIIKLTQTSDDENAPTTIIKSVLTGHGTTWAAREDKEYRGDFEFIHNKKLNAIIPVNIVNIEEYVFGVIAAEMPSVFPIEALKAQAVIARTYGIKSLGKHKRYGYDICDTQSCQVYGGVRSERERTNAAAEATMGLILTYKNKPIEAVFSSNCGGFTQSSKEAGWFTNSYLQPVSDYYDFNTDDLQPYHFKELLQQTRGAYSRFFKNVSPAAFRWSRYIEEPQLREIIRRKKDIGKIKAVIALRRGISGYVNGVRIAGSKGSLILNKENEIKKYLALGMLRSTYFIAEPVLEKGEAKAFIFYGGGWGHGVGLCQTGAGGRAEAGQSFDEILNHYYTGTRLKDVRSK
ncbi:MAG: SpoIID/LytB domain-containing protein [Elusimicrobiota bacterium]|jgi:SpoIID/LytB domain protein|nr:SpoIID/LytB domain-containing protein [Elusimicrobiota bacterium]